ncbi:hypothetical protein [Escherichia coli]|uniref:hypothetical protein n=1 Tax=Escherichia coli TaxID=562 RepID=UPI0037E2FE5D
MKIADLLNKYHDAAVKLFSDEYEFDSPEVLSLAIEAENLRLKLKGHINKLSKEDRAKAAEAALLEAIFLSTRGFLLDCFNKYGGGDDNGHKYVWHENESGDQINIFPYALRLALHNNMLAVVGEIMQDAERCNAELVNGINEVALDIFSDCFLQPGDYSFSESGLKVITHLIDSWFNILVPDTPVTVH